MTNKHQKQNNSRVQNVEINEVNCIDAFLPPSLYFKTMIFGCDPIIFYCLIFENVDHLTNRKKFVSVSQTSAGDKTNSKMIKT